MKWKVVRSAHGLAGVYTEDGEQCITDRVFNGHEHLIAAAPELLAYVEERVEAFWGDHAEDLRAKFRRNYPDHVVVLAEAVIRKAKGSNMEKDREDLELDSSMLSILNELVRPNDQPRRAIRWAILTALPEIGMPEADQEVVREWLKDVEEGRL